MLPEGERCNTQTVGVRVDGGRFNALGKNKPSFDGFLSLQVPMLGDLHRNSKLFGSGFGVVLKNGVSGLSENVPRKQLIALLPNRFLRYAQFRGQNCICFRPVEGGPVDHCLFRGHGRCGEL